MSRTNPKRLLIFFGAGASRAINTLAPLDADLLDAILRRLSRPRYQLEYTQLLSFLNRSFGGRRAHLWDVLLFLHRNGKQDGAKSLRWIIESQIAGVASDVMRTGPGLQDASCRDMMTQVARFQGRVDFVSTNYDITLDGYVAHHLNRWPDAQKAAAYQRMYATGRMNKQWCSTQVPVAVLEDGSQVELNVVPPQTIISIPEESPPKQGKDAVLIKLHGSVNWSYCSRCREPHLVNSPYVQDFISSPIRLPGPKEHPAQHMLITPWESFQTNNGARHRIFAGLRSECLRLLASADYLLFVGYSLPPEDRHIRMMLVEANRSYRKTHRRSRRKILVIDKGENPWLRTRYLSLFQREEIRFYPDGLIDFIEQEGFAKLGGPRG